MFHSGKNVNWKGAPSENCFALSAYSFSTSITDQKDAYTIMYLSDRITDSQSAVAAADESTGSEDSKADQRHGREYFLWQLSCG